MSNNASADLRIGRHRAQGGFFPWRFTPGIFLRMAGLLIVVGLVAEFTFFGNQTGGASVNGFVPPSNPYLQLPLTPAEAAPVKPPPDNPAPGEPATSNGEGGWL